MMLPAGSSKIEPGVTPANDIDFVYNKWSEVKDICGQSRLYGGMHFAAAVPAGEQLCSGMSMHVVDRASLLRDGDADGAMMDFDDASILKVRDM